MKYVESITDFFKQPDWIKNLLFAALCILIPIVGPLVLLGWLATGFWGRRDNAPETFPNFDFGQFSKYLERGLWPFLVSLVASVVLVPVIWIIMVIPMMIIGAVASGSDGAIGSIIGIIVGLIFFVLYIAAIVTLMLVLKPLMIRATLTQDFAKAFDFGFVKQFIKLTWKESLFSSLFLAAVSMILIPLGMIVLCVGMYAAAALVYYAWEHLNKQAYQIFLSRGGTPVELSPKLSDEPPVLV